MIFGKKKKKDTKDSKEKSKNESKEKDEELPKEESTRTETNKEAIKEKITTSNKKEEKIPDISSNKNQEKEKDKSTESKDKESKNKRAKNKNHKSKEQLPSFSKSTFSKIKKDYKVQNPFQRIKKKKTKLSKYQHLKNLKIYLEKAGYTLNDETKVSKTIFKIAAILNAILTIYIFYAAYWRSEKLISIFPVLIVVWTVIYILIVIFLWILFYLIVDIKIFKRRLALEEVLPDFLMLTSSNINAGMPIDQALWFAVRPRFGILAKEIEEVAKRTLVGDELKDALDEFTRKYDSVVLKRSISLLLEGVDSGGKVADIVNKIALDIQNMRTFKKEMAASVTTYVIFISFATVAAAPVLFALSKQLLVIIMSIMANIDFSNAGSSGPGLTFDANAISLNDFTIFSVTTLMMTSTFSAMIISIIKKGNIKEGLNYIPMFIVTSLVIYFIASKILGLFLGGLF